MVSVRSGFGRLTSPAMKFGAAGLQPTLWGVVMMTLFKSLLKNESGAAAAEYALILAIVGAGIAAAAITLGNDISTAINDAASIVASVTF
jgi:pilus assembly protein Flp/PilA